MTVATDPRTTDLIQSSLDRSGLSLRQFAAALGTSPARMSAYTKGRTVPSATLLLRMLDIAGVDVGFRPGRVDSTHTVHAIDADAPANPSHALRWLLQARDHLLEMTPLEAEVKWGRVRALPRDPRWATLLQAVIGAAFRARGLPPPDWTDGTPLREEWQPLERLPVRARERDPELAKWNIRIRTKDLHTL